MATRILFDPRVDLPDGTTGSSPVIVEATPTGIRADGSVFVLPTTLSFTISTAADQLLLAAPAASWGWNLAVRRAGAMLYGQSQAGSVLARRTVTWTDAASVTWADLTDLDPATLEPTPDASASWTATQELAQAAKDAVDALKAGAPGALDTFLELATQLQADESGAAALAALVGTKAPLASPALTGTPTIGGTPVAKTTDISSAVAAVTLAGLGGVTSAQVAATYATLTGLTSETTRAQNAEALKAPLASPAFTGTPTIGGTAVAKTTDITTAITNLVGAAPAALDTLAEIDAQLSTDEGSAAALAALVATKIGLTQAAKNPDLLITGSITRDNNGVITTAAVVWPDGSPGTFTTDAIDATSAINGYHITYGSPVTKTYTQPTITRNAVGAATTVPQIVVS